MRRAIADNSRSISRQIEIPIGDTLRVELHQNVDIALLAEALCQDRTEKRQAVDTVLLAKRAKQCLIDSQVCHAAFIVALPSAHGQSIRPCPRAGPTAPP